MKEMGLKFSKWQIHHRSAWRLLSEKFDVKHKWQHHAFTLVWDSCCVLSPLHEIGTDQWRGGVGTAVHVCMYVCTGSRGLWWWGGWQQTGKQRQKGDKHKITNMEAEQAFFFLVPTSLLRGGNCFWNVHQNLSFPAEIGWEAKVIRCA